MNSPVSASYRPAADVEIAIVAEDEPRAHRGPPCLIRHEGIDELARESVEAQHLARERGGDVEVASGPHAKC
jgi:hypothetical protein